MNDDDYIVIGCAYLVLAVMFIMTQIDEYRAEKKRKEIQKRIDDLTEDFYENM